MSEKSKGEHEIKVTLRIFYMLITATLSAMGYVSYKIVDFFVNDIFSKIPILILIEFFLVIVLFILVILSRGLGRELDNLELIPKEK